MSPVHRFSTQVPLAKRASIQQTLFRFQQRLSALGYDTYLIHARPSKEAGASRGVHARDVTVVPVYGNFWHDDYEICFDRKVAYGRYQEWCWNDLFVVRRCNKCVKRTMLTQGASGREATLPELQLPVSTCSRANTGFDRCRTVSVWSFRHKDSGNGSMLKVWAWP